MALVIVIKSANIYNNECVVSLTVSILLFTEVNFRQNLYFLHIYTSKGVEPLREHFFTQVSELCWLASQTSAAEQRSIHSNLRLYFPSNQEIPSATVFTPPRASLTGGRTARPLNVFVFSSLTQTKKLFSTSLAPSPARLLRKVLAWQLLSPSTLPLIKTLNIPIQRPPLMSYGDASYLTAVKK